MRESTPWFSDHAAKSDQFVMVVIGVISLVSEVMLYVKPPVPGVNRAVPLAFMSLLSIDQSACVLIIFLPSDFAYMARPLDPVSRRSEHRRHHQEANNDHRHVHHVLRRQHLHPAGFPVQAIAPLPRRHHLCDRLAVHVHRPVHRLLGTRHHGEQAARPRRRRSYRIRGRGKGDYSRGSGGRD